MKTEFTCVRVKPATSDFFTNWCDEISLEAKTKLKHGDSWRKVRSYLREMAAQGERVNGIPRKVIFNKLYSITSPHSLK